MGLDRHVAIIICLTVVFVTAVYGQNCGFRDCGQITTTTPRSTMVGLKANQSKDQWTTCYNRDHRAVSLTARETQPTEISFAWIRVYNIVWIHLSTPHVRVEVEVADEDQIARFYVTPSFRDHIDMQRARLGAEFFLRCSDGTSRDESLNLLIEDEDTRAPMFYPPSVSFTVSQQWPPEIPINLQEPIFVRDLDYSYRFADVEIIASPAFVNVVLTPLFVEGGGSSTVPYDYKVELFLAAGVDAGDYTVWLSASDGTHVTPYSISLKVTEVVCKGQKVDPVFGLKGKTNKILYYNSTLTTVPKEGDTFPGVVIQAFNPEDDACSIELSIPNTDYLRVSSLKGEVMFTRGLTLAEVEELGRTWIVEVSATDGEAGKSTTVPLVITNDFEAIHESI